jgi:hypothetical protein
MLDGQSIPSTGSISVLGASAITSPAPAMLDDVGGGPPLTSSSPLDADPAQVLSALDATNLSCTGAGVTVGVISDSFNNLGGAAQDEQDGALPPASQINVLEDDPSGSGTDEGRAMMQVVHDVAPGANLDFYTADVSEQDFASGILALAQAGCKVICDDVSYLDEPFFQTGVIAQAIQTVEQDGVTFLTAAGNEGEEGYQSIWDPLARTSYDHVTLRNTQNFGNNSPVQTITIGSAVSDIIWELQWNQPFGAATTHLGVLVFQNGTLAGEFSNANIGSFTESDFNPGSNDPLIALDLTPGTYQLAIENLSGSDPGEIKDVLFANGTEPFVSLGDANAGTVLGHHASPDAITVGAVDSASTPGDGGTPQSEYFSSSGTGTQLFFNDNGTPVTNAPLTLSPVSVSGVDDIATTLPNGLSDFFGTSCATPSVAGIVADMLQANSDLTPAQVESILQISATAFGSQAVAGAGLVNATLAVASANIFQIYQRMLGRNPETQGLTFWMQHSSSGTSITAIRQAIATSAEASADIINFYQQILDRTPANTEVTFWQNQLIGGSTLSAVHTDIAFSPEATSDVEALYEQILSRPADPGGLSFWQNELSGTTSLAQVRSGIAFSAEAAADVQGLFADVLGQSANSTELAFWQQQLSTGTSLSEVHTQLAESTAAENTLAALYQAAYGSAPSQNVLSSLTNQLATNATLQQVTNDLQNPLIIDTVGGQGITDQSTGQPFAVASISDPQSGSTETATITLLNSSGTATDANGTLSGTGLGHSGAGTYTLTAATPATLTTGLSALVFTPTRGEVSIGQSVTTDVSLTVQNSKWNAGTDTTTSITAQAVGTPTNLDFLYGTMGSDTFNLPSGAAVVGENLSPLGNDVANGFNPVQDIVQLSAAQFPNFAAVQAALTSSGGNAVLHLDGLDTLVLTGINPNNLAAANFRFV